MGEIKSVKVDNWGVFFLQKLQNFFNKTDYCDLTLQFNDNSQLKVHRLVLSACTDYFNVLEQTCEVIDDALLMPNELQADVVVPIVNFMYTGTLEFELKMYGKLLRTAKEINMTVLLKLLEAHRRTMEGVNRAQQRPSSPKNIRKRGPATQTTSHTQMRPMPNSPQQQNQQQQQQQQQQRRILTSANAAPQRRLVQSKPISTNTNQQPQVQQYRQQIGSTSLLKTSVSGTSPLKMQRSTLESTSYAGSTTATYESTMQFKEEQHDDYDIQLGTINQSTSPFEQLRKGYNNNKRPASATFISPPAKKPNIEDVKEFAEQQRMRKQIAAEYGEDQEYEGPMLDDDIHNDDDDDDAAAAVASSSIALATTTTTTNARQHQQGPSIIIKQEPNEKPTIVVKDSANSKMNHAKIISEVLRQYPHLVKSNKNIKLKIMPNIGGHSQKIIVKKEQIDNISAEMASNAANSGGQSQNVVKSPVKQQLTISKPVEKTTSPPQPPQPTRPTLKIAAVASSGAAAAITTTTPNAAPTVPAQKRRIDSKTMHALIALGAENTTGPWLCLRCGVNGRPISIPSYRGFRRHLINTHKETIDTALCEHCGWRSTTNRNLHFHTQVEHKIKTSVYTFPECLMCTEIFIDTEALNEHMVESHPDENQQQCIYCNKIFAKEMQLYTHMKTYHKKQAIDDGIIDYSDDEDDEAMDTQEHETVEEKLQQTLSSSSKDKKIKILSDISLPSAGTLIKLEPSSEANALTTIASGIAASIGLETSEEFISTTSETTITTAPTNEATAEPKFVTADGNEMVLTEEQRKEIMSQLNQEHDGGVVMVLNETSFSDAAAVAAVADTNEDTSQDIAPDHNEEPAHAENEAADNAEASADEDEYDDNNIYSEFVKKTATEIKKDSSGLEESKGSIDNLEWAENLITAHEMEEETIIKTNTEPTEKLIETKVEDNSKTLKKNEDISKKLKELTGDWSDDEIDEDEEMEEDSSKHVEEIPKDVKSKETEILENLGESAEEEKASKVSEKEEEEEGEEQVVEDEEKSTQNVEMTDIDNEDHHGNDEPEDDIDIALKSLHQEDVETTDANVTDELHDTLDSVDYSSNVKESNVSPTDENIKNESVEETENMGIDLPNEADAANAAIEEKPKASNVKDTSTGSDSKNVKDPEEEEQEITTDNEATLKESKEDTTEDEVITENLKPTEEDIATAESGLKAEDNDDAEENISELQDSKIDNKSSTTPAAETPELTEATTSATVDALPTTATTTEDKVKTLISEWGDDDEDDEIEDLGSLI